MEKKNVCYLFVFEGFADWEPALVTTGLNQYSNFEIKSFSFDGLPVRSMGNLAIQPDLSLREVQPEPSDIILLPGGGAWEENQNDAITDFLTHAHQNKTTIAAICAATTILAKMGLFSEHQHTSNGDGYLKKMVPDYTGEANYVNEPAVNDEGIITANGAGMIEFAYEIFKHLEVLTPKEIDGWFKNFKAGGKQSAGAETA